MKTLLFLLFSIPFYCLADQAEVVYEVEYTVNNEVKTGFIQGTFLGNSIDSLFLNNPIEFEKNIKSYDRNQQHIEIISELIDLSSIKNNAVFPIHKFKHGNEKTLVPSNDITSLKLIKIWIKSAYHIEVLSPLVMSDTVWFSNDHKLTYPIGNDAGCRLHVYQFNKKDDQSHLIKIFSNIYLNPESSAIYYNYKKRILEVLYLKKVVIVELCGC